MGEGAYRKLAVMTVLSFMSMYLLMYAMVSTIANIYMSINQVYMAGLMTAPMVVIELLLMRGMYTNKATNAVLIAGSVIIGVAAFLAIRQQTAVGDRQFLRSMIPHHAGAILMCGKADVHDAEIRELCRTIIKGQQAEIDQMTAMLRRMQE